jgi:ParB/RepB/Spo0J family partition protein
MAGKYDLKMISPEDVEFSDSNPRGESPEEISEDESFERLKDSVYEFGVLVPIVVHQQRASSKKKLYRLVDGERRLRAALETGADEIPANIAPSRTPTDDLIQAVHIHMLRRQWSQVAQTRALRRIMNDPQYKKPRMSVAEKLEKLQELTGCTDDRLKSLRRAAKYPEKVLGMVDDGQIVFSHLVQFEESCVEQLEKHYPALLKELGIREVRKVLVRKARQKVLTNSRALMNNIVPVVARAKSQAEKKHAAALLKKFIQTEHMSAEQVLKAFEKEYPAGHEDLLQQCEGVAERSNQLRTLIQQLPAGELASFPKAVATLLKCLTQLRTAISKKLRRIKSISH